MFLEAPGVRATQEVEAILEVRAVIVAPEVALEVARKLAREVVQCPVTEAKASLEVGAPAEVEASPFRDHLAVHLQIQSDSNQINLFPRIYRWKKCNDHA